MNDIELTMMKANARMEEEEIIEDMTTAERVAFFAGKTHILKYAGIIIESHLYKAVK